jgi:hypothetical protein
MFNATPGAERPMRLPAPNPLTNDQLNGLLSFVEKLKPGLPKNILHRPRDITPEAHAALMKAAVKARRDGPLLGACGNSFRVGTLTKLPAAIRKIEREIKINDVATAAVWR